MMAIDIQSRSNLAPGEPVSEVICCLCCFHAPQSHAKRVNGIRSKAEGIACWTEAIMPKENDRVLVIDTIGLLSAAYKYGNLAFIGGGFGKGIHNTLEAATFGLPVIFGPRYKKFREAEELVTAGAGFSVHDFVSFKSRLNRFIDEPEILKTSGEFANNYVFSKIGATSHILDSTLDG